MIRLEPALQQEELPKPTFICPEDKHDFRTMATEQLCVKCSLTRDLPPSLEPTYRAVRYHFVSIEVIRRPFAIAKPEEKGATIGLGSHDGAKATRKERLEANRLRWNSNHYEGYRKDSVEARAPRLFAKVGGGLAIPSEPIEDAAQLLKEASMKHLLRAFSAEDCVGASVFATVRSDRWKIPISPKEIASELGTNRYRVNDLRWTIARGLNVAQWQPTFLDYFHYYLPRLDLTQRERNMVLSWFEEPEVKDWTGRSPMPTGIVAAAVYLVSLIGAGDRMPTGRKESKRSQTWIARQLRITEVCLRTSANELESRLEKARRI